MQMSQPLTTKNFSRSSLRDHESARSVLMRMAEDHARAERIRTLKSDRPDLTWEQIADHVGVKERSVHNWAATGGIKYENAEKLAELFGVSVDYIWRGEGGSVATMDGDTPDLLGALSPEDAKEIPARLDAIETDVAEIKKLLRQLMQQVAALRPPPTEPGSPPSRRRNPPDR